MGQAIPAKLNNLLCTGIDCNHPTASQAFGTVKLLSASLCFYQGLINYNFPLLKLFSSKPLELIKELPREKNPNEFTWNLISLVAFLMHSYFVVKLVHRTVFRAASLRWCLFVEILTR